MATKEPKRILIVDDGPILHKTTEKHLKGDGYEVYSAYNGDEALELMGKQHFHLILMDIIMTGQVDGKGVVKIMSETEHLKNIPVIFISNTVDLQDDNGEHTLKVGDKSYRAFAKPLHYRKLLSVIKKEINRNQFGGPPPKFMQE